MKCRFYKTCDLYRPNVTCSYGGGSYCGKYRDLCKERYIEKQKKKEPQRLKKILKYVKKAQVIAHRIDKDKIHEVNKKHVILVFDLNELVLSIKKRIKEREIS